MQINEDFTSRKKFSDIGRYYITDFVNKISKQLPDGTLLLDAGAGECAYKRYFSHCNYKSADLGVGDDNWNYSHLDYITPLDKLPIEDNTFDAVLCTQVLEHLSLPKESVQEMYRVLKKGGKLFLTVPMAQDEHQVPYDFFRYTSYGLKYLFNEAGFESFEIVPFGGMYVRWAYELPRSMTILPALKKNGTLNFLGLLFLPIKLIWKIVIKLLQYLFVFLDRFDKNKTDPFGWSAIAIK
jgi:SAM-dependent methyltransferase